MHKHEHNLLLCCMPVSPLWTTSKSSMQFDVALSHCMAVVHTMVQGALVQVVCADLPYYTACLSVHLLDCMTPPVRWVALHPFKRAHCTLSGAHCTLHTVRWVALQPCHDTASFKLVFSYASDSISGILWDFRFSLTAWR